MHREIFTATTLGFASSAWWHGEFARISTSVRYSLTPIFSSLCDDVNQHDRKGEAWERNGKADLAFKSAGLRI